MREKGAILRQPRFAPQFNGGATPIWLREDATALFAVSARVGFRDVNCLFLAQFR
jgi:hypothetical protein